MDLNYPLFIRDRRAHHHNVSPWVMVLVHMALATSLPITGHAQELLWNWATTFDAGSDEHVRDIAIDPGTGNIYLVGTYRSDSPTAGGFGLPASNGGSLDAFIVKLDPSGNTIWSRQIGSDQEDAGIGIAVSTSGRVAITGSYRGAITALGLNSNGQSDAFVATFDPTGAFLWARQVRSPNRDTGTGVVFVGNTLVTYGSFTHNPGVVGVTTIASLSVGREYAYLNAFASNGDALWSFIGGSDNDVLPEGIATDGSNVYVVGGTKGNSLEWLGAWGPISTAQTTTNTNALYCSAFSSTGSHLWTRMINNPGDSDAQCSGVGVDCGLVYITGHTHNGSVFPGGVTRTIPGLHDYLFVAGLNKTNGSTAWVRTASSTIDHGARGLDLAVGDKGQVYVAGSVEGDVTTDAGVVLNGTSNDDLLIARFNRDGTAVWIDRRSSPDDDQALAIASQGSGELILGGSYQNGLNLGTSVYLGSNGDNAFAASFSDPEWANYANDPSRFAQPAPACAGSASVDLSLTQLGYATAVSSSTNVSSPGDALGAPNGVGALFDVTGGSAVFDLRDTLPLGEAIGITWRRETGAQVRMQVSSSLDGTNWTAASTWTTSSASFTQTYHSLTASARYLRIVRDGSSSFGTFQVDAIGTNTGFQVGGTWSGGSYITPAGVFSPSIAGSGTHPVTYTVTLAGCTYTTTLNMVVLAPPIATLSGPVQVCPGESGLYTLTLNNVEQYRWQRRTAGVGAWASFNNSQTSLSLTFTEATDLRCEVRSPGCANTTFTNILTVTPSDVTAPILPTLPNISLTATANDCSATPTFTLPTATDNCSVCDPGAIAGYTRLGVFQGHAYYLSNTASFWPAANTAANATGGHLVSITSAAENTWLAAQTTGIIAYTGLNDIANEGQFVWANGEPVVFTSWASGQPDNGVILGQDWVTINFNGTGQWDDEGGVLAVQRQHILEFDCAVWQASGPAPNTAVPVGTHTVVYMAQDGAGNQSQQQFQITVQDVTPPVITMPASIITLPASGYPGCSAQVPDLTVQATVSDNCATTRFQSIAPGTSINSPTTVWIRAQDASGNRDSVAVLLQLVDVTAPIITSCPNTVTLTVPNAGDVAIPYTYPVPTSNDCGTVVAELITGLMPGENFPVGETEVRWRISDASGNFSECLFTVTVGSNDAPQLSCPTLPPVPATGASCSAVVNYTPPVAVDLQDGNIPASLAAGSLPPGSTFPLGNSLVTYSAQDADGNTATCSFTVTVVDNIAPVFDNCPGPGTLTVNTDPNSCEHLFTFPTIESTDNCDADTESDYRTYILEAGNTVWQEVTGQVNHAFAPGLHQLMEIHRDDSGNQDTCSWSLNVVDANPPSITCPTVLADLNVGAACTSVLPDYTGDASTTGNCSGNAGLVITQFPAPNTPLGPGSHAITLTATQNGLSESCSFVVSVVDNTAPQISCPASISVNVAAGTCGAVVSYTEPTGTDNCAGATTMRTAGPASGSTFPVGITTVTHTVTDAAGLSASCSFTVTVVDNIAPQISCPDNISVNAIPGSCGAVVSYVTPFGTDNCGGATTTRIDGLASGSTFPVGTTTVTHQVTDAAGLTASCSFTVTVVGAVVDIEYPVSTICQNAGPILPSVQTPAGGVFSDASQLTPGLIDPTTGAFNPALANPGLHVLGYVFSGACTSHDWFTINVTAATTNTTTAASCDSYTWAVNGATYTASGTYSEVVGCVTEVLDLTITPNTTNTTTAASCDSYTWSVNGQTYTASGNYTQVVGCVTEVLDLTIGGSSTNTTTAAACDSYTWAVNGATYTASGTYTEVVGCVTEVLDLTITPNTTNTTTAASCDSYTWSVNGATYTTSGTYSEVVGCVTEVLDLTITPNTTNTTTAASCTSYTWSVNGATYTASGTYTEVVGCVTEVLDLTITPNTTNTTTAAACDSYTWAVNGATYTASGTYSEVIGCVTEVLDLTITPNTTNTTTAAACDSYTWSVNGATYTASGTYSEVIGCVTEVLNLTITPNTTNTTTAAACDSYTWAVNGATYTTSGTYSEVVGCVTEVLDLTITPNTTNTTSASACDSYTWAVNGATYTTSGTYSEVVGCVTEVLDLTITPNTTNTTTAASCDSYTWAVNGATYTASGTYSEVVGCVTEVLDLTITPNTTNTTTAASCDSYTWSVNGQTYTTSGTYSEVVGCVTEVLDLTITPNTTNTTTAAACDSYTWAVNGATYTTSGIYTEVVGCVTEVLDLTIGGSSTNTTTAAACDSYTWAVNGATYTQSGTYTVINDCTSEILELTITESTTITATVSACESYTWSVNNTTYTTSGTYTEVAGCVTKILVLTIHTPDFNASNAGPDVTTCGLIASLGATGNGTWSAPQGLLVTDPSDPNSTVSASSPGTYELYWSVSVGSCNDLDTVLVTFGQSIDAAFLYAQSVLCTNATPPSPWVAVEGGTFSATPNGLLIDAATGAIQPDASVPGAYTIYHSFGGDCPAVDSTTLIVSAAPTVLFSTIPALCTGSEPIDLGPLALPDGGTWSGPNVSEGVFQALVPGTNVLSYTYSDGTCTSTNTLEVIVNAAPIADAGPDLSSCSSDIIMQAVTPTGNGAWSFDTDLTISSVNTADALVSSPTPGTYELVWTVQEGQCAGTDTVSITFLDPGTDVWVNAGEDQTLELATATTLEGTATAGASLTWTLIQGSALLYDATEPVAYLTDLVPGTYEVVLTASLSECSSVSDTVHITVLDLFIPEGFSPNDDGVNDTFRITGLAAYPGANLQIYDRWGIMVHENTDYANEWKGTGRNGHDLPDDTYFYVLNIPGRDTYKGHLIIKR
ncbi:MAG: HYR domain-containing protein [Flavobacteriales bacterium]